MEDMNVAHLTGYYGFPNELSVFERPPTAESILDWI